jgi:hypothetical protein
MEVRLRNGPETGAGSRILRPPREAEAKANVTKADKPERNNAPRERRNTALFDIVKRIRTTAHTRAADLSCPGPSAAKPGAQGDTSGSRFAILALGPRKSGLPDLRAFTPISGRPEIGVSFRARKRARCTRPGHETDARG